MISFIDKQRASDGVEPICAVPISPTTYYDYKARQTDPSRLSERRCLAVLCEEIERVCHGNRSDQGVQYLSMAHRLFPPNAFEAVYFQCQEPPLCPRRFMVQSVFMLIWCETKLALVAKNQL